MHINLGIAVNDDGSVSAKTFVSNKGLKSKRIDNAFLLIGPESESPIDTFNQILKSIGNSNSVVSTNEITVVKINDQYYDHHGRAFIPLPFFYSENIAIGDERLSYRASISTDGFEVNKTYSVRFFIKGDGRYHRSTHDSFRYK